MPRVTRHTAHPPRLQLHCHHLFLSKRRFHPPSKRAYLNTGTRQLTLDFTLTKQVFSLSNELPNHVDHRANHTAPPTSPFILGVEHDYPFVPTLSTFLGDPSAPLPPPPRSVVFNSTPNPSPHSTSSATPVVHPLIAGDMEQEGRIVSAPLGVPRTILSAGLDLASYRITESDILSEGMFSVYLNNPPSFLSIFATNWGY